jgi:hypothetical protein
MGISALAVVDMALRALHMALLCAWTISALSFGALIIITKK